MPWKETVVLDERMRFVLECRRSPSESMAVLCRRFGISRKTGYNAPAGSPGGTEKCYPCARIELLPMCQAGQNTRTRMAVVDIFGGRAMERYP